MVYTKGLLLSDKGLIFNLNQKTKGIKMKLTIKKVNKAIQEIEAGWELVKGEGYFYWVHDTDMSYLDLQTVGVYRLNDFTLDRWIEEFTSREPSYGTLAWYDQEVA